MSILVLSSHLFLGLPSALFPAGFTSKPCLHVSSPQKCYMPSLSHPSRFDHPNNIWRAVQIIKLLVMQSYVLPSYLVPLRPNYIPQHPVLEHPDPLFFPECYRPSFTLKKIVNRLWAVWSNSRGWIPGRASTVPATHADWLWAPGPSRRHKAAGAQS